MPFTRLASQGRATRPWDKQTARSSTDAVAKAFDREVDKPIVDAIHKIADARVVPMAQIALAWVLSKPVVSCVIVGATKPNHLQDAVSALAVELTETEITALEEPYTAQDNYWWQRAFPRAQAQSNGYTTSPRSAWRERKSAATTRRCPKCFICAVCGRLMVIGPGQPDIPGFSFQAAAGWGEPTRWIRCRGCAPEAAVQDPDESVGELK